ncbi:uncharacterized protein G2W53_028596 [Senna tora]|uniref:Uncharacterized protein n=1 Tax=Senna tora TaxID=362788 RepID=A0A834W9V6_9FABA|nr:uncharacterized protein G2W53_028596 [Senna tora]
MATTSTPQRILSSLAFFLRPSCLFLNDNFL